MPVSIVDNSEVIPVRSKLSGLMYGTEEGRRGMAVLRGEEIRIRRLSSPGQTSP